MYYKALAEEIFRRQLSWHIGVDWKQLERINKYRNDIEHYYNTLKNESAQQLISDSFLIIRDFIADELEEDPKSLLGEEYWEILADVNEVYANEKQECDSSLEKLDYFSNEILSALQVYRCNECDSGLIETEDSDKAIDASFKCRACEKGVMFKSGVWENQIKWLSCWVQRFLTDQFVSHLWIELLVSPLPIVWNLGAFAISSEHSAQA